jgi:hypothetical protein
MDPPGKPVALNRIARSADRRRAAARSAFLKSDRPARPRADERNGGGALAGRDGAAIRPGLTSAASPGSSSAAPNLTLRLVLVLWFGDAG